MTRLANQEASELSETSALRDRRDLLLRKVDRARYRLHCRPDLTKELQQATNALLKLELEARERPAPSPSPRPIPLGDAGAAGGHAQGRLPYKDD